MSKIYIYCIRRSKIDNQQKYVDLIPKLSSEIYNSNKEGEAEYDFIKEIKKKYNYTGDKIKLFNNLLAEYIPNKIENPFDQDAIIKLNLNKFREREYSDEDFDEFLIHLFRAHGDMKYGLYFTLGFADDDDDFENKFIKLSGMEDNLSIIFYTKLMNLLHYLFNILTETLYDMPVLYVNEMWSYGKPNSNTITLNPENKYSYTDDDFDRFIEQIYKKYNGIHIDNNTELICVIPLPTEIFKYFYVPRGDRHFKHKYLKYKNKYLNLKNKKYNY
jgi:hypothetical protein